MTLSVHGVNKWPPRAIRLDNPPRLGWDRYSSAATTGGLTLLTIANLVAASLTKDRARLVTQVRGADGAAVLGQSGDCLSIAGRPALQTFFKARPPGTRSWRSSFVAGAGVDGRGLVLSRWPF